MQHAVAHFPASSQTCHYVSQVSSSEVHNDWPSMEILITVEGSDCTMRRGGGGRRRRTRRPRRGAGGEAAAAASSVSVSARCSPTASPGVEQGGRLRQSVFVRVVRGARLPREFLIRVRVSSEFSTGISKKLRIFRNDHQEIV